MAGVVAWAVAVSGLLACPALDCTAAEVSAGAPARAGGTGIWAAGLPGSRLYCRRGVGRRDGRRGRIGVLAAARSIGVRASCTGEHHRSSKRIPQEAVGERKLHEIYPPGVRSRLGKVPEYG